MMMKGFGRLSLYLEAEGYEINEAADGNLCTFAVNVTKMLTDRDFAVEVSNYTGNNKARFI